MATISDEALSQSGLAVAEQDRERVLLIGCGALAREILALIAANRLEQVFALECLPATLHNHPDRIPEAVRAKVRDARRRGFSRIFVAYADCGTGGLLDKVCHEEGVERIAGPHCYAFFDGNAAFASRAEDEIGTFFLTDFLVRQFDTLVWRGLGLDRHPDLLPMYFGHYDTVVYLAQTDNPDLDRQARAAAERLGLSYRRRHTGYGELADFMQRAAQE